MPDKNIPLQGDFNNSPTPKTLPDSLPLPVQIDLTQRNIDNLMAAIISQMESLAETMRELAAVKSEAVKC